MGQSYRDFEIPEEIRCTPVSFVGFSGLDIATNAVHKSIWDGFSSNRQADRALLNICLLTPDHVYPVSKPKRSSYEWYVPRGILKRNWINKNLYQIPSLIVFFYQLDFDDSHFSEKKLDCASKLQAIRLKVDERNTKIVLVLIQTSSTAVGSEEIISSERAASLCTVCALDSKLLFLLNLNDNNMMGYIVRLEAVFLELAHNYYQHEIRIIKSHRELLSKSTHQYLLVRHQFKMAFYSEMKQDLTSAQKYYGQSYLHLLDIKLLDGNIYEMKVVASFITYKLCRCYFALDQPRDAISHFNGFIERFRSKHGPQELEFEHLCWLSKQFSMFGDLFDDAIKYGLTAVQARHPGFYYETGAQYAVHRKYLCSTLCKDVTSYPTEDPLLGWNDVDYYGQRSWRITKLESTMDMHMEQMATTALQYREKYYVNHSMIIIGLLGKSITHFKEYRSERKRKYLVVQMAEEYYFSKEYGKALTLLSRMMWEYRKDKWWKLVTDLLKKSLSCAFLTASLQEYLDLSIESIVIFDNDNDKLKAYENIDSIVNKRIPSIDLPDTDHNKWTQLLNCWNAVIVDMSVVSSFIECKTAFSKATTDFVELEVFLRCDFPEEIEFSKLTLNVASGFRNSEMILYPKEPPSPSSDSFTLSSKISQFNYKFAPLPSEISTEIQITSVNLHVGSCWKGQNEIILRFSGNDGERNKPMYSKCCKERMEFSKITSKLSAIIAPTESKLNINVCHSSPNLLSEWYPIDITIINEEISDIYNCTLHVSLIAPDSSPLHSTTEMATDLKKIDGNALPLCINVSSIVLGNSYTKRLLLKTRTIDTRILSFKVTYGKSEDDKGTFVKEHVVNVDTVNVFEVSASFLSKKCQPISKIYSRECTIMRTEIGCVSPWPIFIKDTSFNLEKDLKYDATEYKGQLKDKILKNGDIGVEVVPFVIEKHDSDTAATLGTFSIYWKREGMEDEYVTCADIQLPQMEVEALPINVQVELSSPGYIRMPLPMSITLYNYTTDVVTFDVNVEHNEWDAFMFAGNKQTCLTVLPSSEHSIEYNLFPLQSGFVPLPYININVINNNNNNMIQVDQLAELLKRSIPTSLFVFPPGKGS